MSARDKSLGEIEGAFEMSRFGVMKHLRILEAAGLVTTHKVGRTKLHYLNAVPIRELQERWIHKFAAGASAGPPRPQGRHRERSSKAATETVAGDVVELERKPEHVFAVWIRATPEQVWEAAGRRSVLPVVRLQESPLWTGSGRLRRRT